jgi:hypothetical protein
MVSLIPTIPVPAPRTRPAASALGSRLAVDEFRKDVCSLLYLDTECQVGLAEWEDSEEEEGAWPEELDDDIEKIASVERKKQKRSGYVFVVLFRQNRLQRERRQQQEEEKKQQKAKAQPKKLGIKAS